MDSIGRYRITAELGRGAMGVVYRAMDPAIGRTVAIKTIRLNELAGEDERAKLRERLFREAQSAGILSHPGIVTIYDIGEQDGMAYVAMECVDGPTLDRLMASRPPDGALVLSLLNQTAAALDYAHKRGIVHRDIKPANIIVHDGSVAKITDFGVAKIQSHQMTQAGSMIGTPSYMSPEQIQGKPVDGCSDQYSLAIIAYELLTGEKPFSAESLPGLAFKIVHEDPGPVQRLNPSLGWTVDTVIRRALSKNATDRYPTCSDFVFALENACRACKDWKPLVSGSALEMATLVDARPAVPVEAPNHEPTPAVDPDQAPEVRAPALLRFVRVLALVVIGGGLVVAMVVAALQWSDQRHRAEPAPVAEQPPARVQKPSAMGSRPDTLPGEGTAPRAPAPPHAAAPGSTAPAEPETEKQAASAPEESPAERVYPKPSPREVPTRVVTNPPGATLVIDGKPEYTCKSPCTLPLTPGRHTLSANLAGYRPTLKILNLPTDSENFLNLDRITGTMAIRTEPPGATIILNGQPRAEKTPAMIALPVGKYNLELLYNGQREEQDVTVRESTITNVAVEFGR